MARKRPNIEGELTALKQVADKGTTDQLTAAVAEALVSTSNLLVEQAARLIPEKELRVAEDWLLAAYERFLVEPSETDKGCRAKLPLVEALTHLEYDDPGFYRRGMLYQQWEPVWGKSVDTAGNVRGACGYGLIQSRLASPASTMLELVDLLNDHDRLARYHAAKAIGMMGAPASVPVLRMKVYVGDESFEVSGECFRGILMNDSTGGIGFVAPWLKADTDIAIEAAAALGECRDAKAIQAIIDACQDCSADLLDAFYISIGLSRQAIAIDFLLQQIRSNSANSCRAVKAMAPNRFYPGIVDQVTAAVTEASDRTVAATFRSSFHDGR